MIRSTTVSIPSNEALLSFNGMENLLIKEDVTTKLQSLAPVVIGVERRYTDAEEAMVLPSQATMIVVKLLFSGTRHLCHGDNFRLVISLISS